MKAVSARCPTTTTPGPMRSSGTATAHRVRRRRAGTAPERQPARRHRRYPELPWPAGRRARRAGRSSTVRLVVLDARGRAPLRAAPAPRRPRRLRGLRPAVDRRPGHGRAAVRGSAGPAARGLSRPAPGGSSLATESGTAPCSWTPPGSGGSKASWPSGSGASTCPASARRHGARSRTAHGRKWWSAGSPRAGATAAARSAPCWSATTNLDASASVAGWAAASTRRAWRS